jgi:cytochrome c556
MLCSSDFNHLFVKIATMKAVVILAAIAGSAAAFAPQGASKTSTAVKGAMEDLKDIAEKSNPVLKVSANK